MKHMILTVIAGTTLVSAASAEVAPAPIEAGTTLEVTVTPTKPYLLPDGKTKITVKKERIYLGRGGDTGTVQLMTGDSVFRVVMPTVVTIGNYSYAFKTAPRFEYREEREEDMIHRFVSSCSISVAVTKKKSTVLPLKELTGTLIMDCKRSQLYELKTVSGEGGQFVCLDTTTADISRFHPDPELGARLQVNVVTAFGAKAITLRYKKKTEVVIGPETITLRSSSFEYKTKTMKLEVSSAPSKSTAEAMILDYGAKP